MPAVAITNITTKCRDLDDIAFRSCHTQPSVISTGVRTSLGEVRAQSRLRLFFVRHWYQHHAKLGANSISFGKDAHDFLRRSVGRDIVIRRLTAQQKITYATP